MKNVGVGILGCGVQGERMKDRFEAQESCDVVAIYDVGKSDICTVGSVEELLAFEDVSLVYISTPPDTHLHLLEAAIATGTPILCEKPLCGSRDIVAASQLPNLPHVAFNFYYRHFNAVNRTLKRILPENLIRIDFVCHFERWPRVWQGEAGDWLSGNGSGGYTREVFSHFAFLLVDLFGDLAYCSSSVERESESGSESSVVAQLQCGGTPLRVIGSVGGGIEEVLLIFRGVDGQEVRLVNWVTIFENGELIEDLDDEEISLYDEIQAMSNGKDHNLPSLKQALQVLKVVEAIVADSE